ncbi:S-layer homology domain-containing protein [Candidatus Epulonipiscium viviparus]|uniref:S-layer homology domain-containing protein n=1 Tax=Candidatus Epulonipiscium viviparus TaxID=420336 RepID=UPI0027380655|nr:S-layer homology domain-containing protein [Candidatus Epulopiscium viviparus]
MYSDWFVKFVTWTAENNLFNSYGDNTFRPNAPLTREELVFAIYNYSMYVGIAPIGASSVYAFNDGATVSRWAVPACEWAIANGILAGKDGNRLDPKGTATRAEICAIINRFLTIYNID